MKGIRNSLFYIVTIGGFSALIYWVITEGVKLQQGRAIKAHGNARNQWYEFLDSLRDNLSHPLALLLAQIVTIICVARLFGWICKKIKQPVVIGEMLAGIVLGPSLMGLYFPDFSAVLFPKESFGNLQFLSQIGLILFMYIIGMELDLKVLRNKAKDAVVISHSSIITPFALGVSLAFFIYQQFAPGNVQFSSFALFIGIAMSITAFPVLARIVQERGIHKTKIGTIVITCAAADDITAWCMLAAVIAIVKAGSFISALYTIALAAAYVVLMIKVVRPFLKRVGDLYPTKERISKPIVAIFFITLIVSAYATEVIGIHALFGAFMAGAIMPENTRFRDMFIEKMEDVALVLLLPLFFVFTGLRTQIGLINDPELWKVTGMIILVAVMGKFIGSTFAAKYVGQSWKDSLTIGALMNTRGLMELVVLNIGYDLGVLGPEIFAMMVIMALVTTFMTGPALDIINWAFRKKKEPVVTDSKELDKYKILLSFDESKLGKNLLRLANAFIKKRPENSAVTVMHLSPTEELHHLDMAEYETESFKPVIEESAKLDQQITTLFKASSDITSEITNVVNKGDYDLLLVGLGQSIYEGSLLGKVLGFTTRIINPGKLLNTVTGRENIFDIFDSTPFDDRTKRILADSQKPVGLLMDKNFTKADKVFIPLFDSKDSFLVDYAEKLIHNNGAKVILLDAEGNLQGNGLKDKTKPIEQKMPNNIAVLGQREIEKEFLQQQDLVIISLESWKKLVEKESPWLADSPSTLIISPSDDLK